jgi:hypothetical protein
MPEFLRELEFKVMKSSFCVLSDSWFTNHSQYKQAWSKCLVQAQPQAAGIARDGPVCEPSPWPRGVPEQPCAARRVGFNLVSCDHYFVSGIFNLSKTQRFEFQLLPRAKGFWFYNTLKSMNAPEAGNMWRIRGRVSVHRGGHWRVKDQILFN